MTAPAVAALDVDVAGLVAELRRGVRGEVRFDDGTRAVYAHDSSNYRQVPIGVVVPRDRQDVVSTVEACRSYGAPLLPRGGGTSLAGQCVNVAVVLDFSKYLRHVVAVDRARKTARVEPGVVLDDLQDAARRGEPSLMFGPDPSTHDRCTLGGMIGNNSCGTHSVMAEFAGPGARMAHNVEALEVLTYDGIRLRVGPTPEDELEAIVRAGGRRGEIYAGLRNIRDRYADRIRERFPNIQRRVSGYNLDELLPENGFNVARALVGTEGTCVTVLEATVSLIDTPGRRSLALLAFEDIFAAADAVPMVREHRPMALEGFDDVLIDNNRAMGLNEKALDRLPPGGGWLLVEFGDTTVEDARARAEELRERIRSVEGFLEARLYVEPEEEEQIWDVRESGLGATAFVPGKDDAWEGWEDAGVPPEALGSYLRMFRALLDRYGYETSLYGHFGQGCVHCRINFEMTTAEGIDRYRRFVDQAADLVLEHGGSLSGEHGDGQSRGELLEKMYGPDLVGAFGEFKALWDPEGRMNPGKVVDPYPITSNLKQGTDYAPAAVRTHFSYPEDHGDFAHAALRCVGVGKCRQMGGGTMCPSYMVTREEEHSTRGRARILFEMLNGQDIELWKSDEVFDALELCLACKGCKGECPVSVDMATYKAEFLSHYYRGRLRPRAAYAMGLIPWWARMASTVPRLANWVARAPVLSTVLKKAGNIAPQRDAPRFAERTFRDWFRRRRGATGGTRVVLWPDTFSDRFHPGTAAASAEVLEAAGCEVVVPQAWLCCGRPLYDYGMLDLARGLLRRVLDELRPHIRAGIPVVGIEPSCVAVFRDELPNLFPDDQDAQRLARQSFLLSEFLVNEGWTPPKLHRRAVVHGHCHHKAVLGFEAEEKLLDAMGLEYRILESGCCGMAGSFGFEAGERYEVGKAAGERVLLPEVRQAEDETLILTDGFSCRTMIEQETDRRALHLADVLRMALHTGPRGPQEGRPEDAVEERAVPANGRRTARRATSIGVVLGAAGMVALALRGRRVLSRRAAGRGVWPASRGDRTAETGPARLARYRRRSALASRQGGHRGEDRV